MSNTRFIHGWECQCCFDLFSTERKAINCFNRDGDIWDGESDKAIFQKGHECLDCLEIYRFKYLAKGCCNLNELSEEPDKDNWDKIGKVKQ